jgi:predicted nucleotide-binding protein
MLPLHNASVTLRSRTIARLAHAFDGGAGPTLSSIEALWIGEDAVEYLPSEGNKADRVRLGLTALRDGRGSAMGQPALPPDHAKLQRVANELAERLVADGFVDEADITDALADSDADADRAAAACADPVTLAAPAPETRRSPTVSADGAIFVVHGHADRLRTVVVEVLKVATGRNVIVLHEQASTGDTAIEKLERCAEDAAYAVVLLTGDDTGGPKGGSKAARARQNVIFELGFFIGRLGRKRIAVLLEPRVEQPSDLHGLVHIPLDPHGAWQGQLVRELDDVGITIASERIR